MTLTTARTGMSILLTLLMWLVAPASAALAANPLVAQWHLDEGHTSSDEVSATPDSSGNGNHATVNYGAEDPAGRFGKAMKVGEHNWVRASGAPLEDQSFTVMAWVKAAQSPGSSRYVLANGSGPGCVPAAFAMYTSHVPSANAGGLEFYVTRSDQIYAAPGVPANTIWNNQWHMVAGSFDGTRARFYFDGDEVGNGVAVPGFLDYDNENDQFTMGGYGRFNTLCSPTITGFKGSFDEVRVYNRPLTAGEIQRIADFGGTNPPVLSQEPIVHTSSADQITASSARISGTIDNRGDAVLYRVEYGKTQAYGKFGPTLGLAGAEGAQNVASTISGLDPDSDYHARLVSGDAVGEDVAFHTTGQPRVRFTASEFSVAEGGGPGELTVERAGGADQTSTVSYATSSGSAQAGSDFTATSGTLTFTPGETTETIEVPITSDNADEPDESLSVTLASPSAGLTIGTPGSAQLEILDDDLSPDTTAPTTAIALDPPAPNGFGFYTGLVTVTVSASDDRPGTIQTRCMVDPEEAPASFDALPGGACGGTAFQLGALGEHNVYAASRDAAGNTGPVVKRSFRIDDAPDTTITEGPSGEVWRPNHLFRFAASIPGSRFECNIDDGPWRPCASPFETGVLSQAFHTFEVRAITAGGTPDPTPARQTFTVLGEKTRRMSCDVRPVGYLPLMTFRTPKPELYACQIGTLSREGCPTKHVCTPMPQACPFDTRCTLTTKVAFFDADLGVNWGVRASAGLRYIQPFGIDGDRIDRPDLPPATAFCQTGADGDRCTATVTTVRVGTKSPLWAGCGIALYRGAASLGETVFRDHSVRRIECEAEWRIEPIPDLAAVPTGVHVQVSVGIAGILIANPNLLGFGATAQAAAGRPRIARVRRSVAGPGPVTFKLKLNRAAKRLLKRKRRLPVQLGITFTPTGGQPERVTRRITITQPERAPRLCKVRRGATRLPRCARRP